MKKITPQYMKRMFQKLILGVSLTLFSFVTWAQQAKEIGSVNAFKQSLHNSSVRAGAKAVGLRLEGPTGKFDAQVNAVYDKAGVETYAGKVLNHGWAEFHVQFKQNKAKGLIVLFDEEKAFEFTTNAAGLVVVQEKAFDKTVAVDRFKGLSPSVSNAGTAGAPGTTADGTLIPLYQSNPGAATVVYLDFDGEYVANTPWNEGNPVDAAKPNGSADNIRVIWEMVAEDFAPFNLNVTTDRAVYDATPAGRRQMVIFTPTCSFAGCPGGVAYISGFSWSSDLPCWAFISPTDAANAGEVASHEIGHTFGLLHDGRNLPDGGHEEYYGGHANWGPIMGVAYGRTVSHFSKGEYANANNTEDDYSIMTSSVNGFGYRTDDHGSTAASATHVTFVNNTFERAGIISTAGDKDYFKFTLASPTQVSIQVKNKYMSNSNLNTHAQLLNSNQQVVAESSPQNSQAAVFTDILLTAGDYYLVLDGVGEGNPITGYSDYGSLGGYVVTGTITSAPEGCSDPAWNAATAYNGGAVVSYLGNIYTAKWWTQNDQPDLNTGEGKPWNLTGVCAVTNSMPLVTFTAPAKHAIFNQGQSVTLKAEAIDPDGTISRVEFLNASDGLIFSDDTAPYEFVLTSLPIGSYVYKVRAYDNHNLASDISFTNFDVVRGTFPVITLSSSLQGQVFYEYPSDGRKIDVALHHLNATEAPIDSVKYIIVDTGCNGPGCTTVRRFTTTTAPFGLNFDPIYTVYATTQSGVNTEISAIAFSNGIASDQYTIYVKVKPLPELSFVSPANNVNVSKNAAIVPIDVTVNSHQVPIDSVVYRVYDTKVTGTVGVTTERKFVLTAPYDFDLPVIGGNTFTKIFALAYGDGGKVSRSQEIQINYNEVPTVLIYDPASTFKYNVGGSVTIKATVGDVDGTIAQVEIYSPHIPNSTITLTAPPYEATFNNLETSGIRGATTFVVKATDNQGGVNGASIDVVENKAPNISIIAPLPQYNNNNIVYLVGGTLTVSAHASDIDGSITKVEISQGTNAPVVLTNAPYTATFSNLPAPAPDGSIYFQVKAYDNDGGVSTKLIVAYKNRLPLIAITAPANNASYTFGTSINLTTLAQDIDGAVAKVEFFDGATKIGESTTSPFSYTWTNASVGTHALTAKAVDDLGSFAISSVVTVEVTGASTCTVPAWVSTTAYHGGTRVSKNGTVYEAKWWTQGADPVTHSGTYDEWKVIGPCNARLADEESLSEVTLSPVPFESELFINLKAQSTVVLYDLFGQKVGEAEGTGILSISTAHLASGMYVCMVNSNGARKSFTVLKK